MKLIVTALPLGEAVSLRGFGGVLACIAVAPLMGGWQALVPRHWPSALAVSGLLLIGLYLFPYSLRHMPLAEATILESVNPVFVAILSPWLLGERVGWRRWGAVFLGFCGAALVVRPGFTDVEPIVAVPLFVGFLVALRNILLRRHMADESALALALLANLGAGISGLATLPLGWQPLDSAMIGLIAVAAMLVSVSQVMMASAFRHGDATVISCLKFSGIVWAALIGWLVWDDRLAPLDWAGAGLIALAGVIITIRTGKSRT